MPHLLVQLGNTKKVVTCEKSEIYDSVMRVFQLKRAVDIQIFDHDFEEWVTLDESYDVPEKARLMIHYSDEDLESDVTVAASSSTISSHNFSADVSFESTPDSPCRTEGASNKGWLLNFILPDFPLNIKAELNEISITGNPVTASTRRKILQILFNSVSAQELYPSPFEYRSVCLTLVQKYPQLADKKSKDCTGTWVESLRQSFRDMRRPLVNNERVRIMKRKYGFGKSPKAPETVSTIESISPAKRQIVSYDTINEDPESIQCHIRKIKEECAKVNKDYEVIEDRMRRSYIARRQEVQKANDIGIILGNYPALKFAYFVLNEANAIFKSDVKENLIEALDKFKIVRLKEKLINFNLASPAVTAYCKGKDIPMILSLLPQAFKESTYSDYFLHISEKDLEEKPKHPYPVMFLKDNQLKIFVEYKELCSASDMEEGLCLLISVFWIFDIVIPKKIRKTIQFICCLLGIPIERRMMSVQRIINLL